VKEDSETSNNKSLTNTNTNDNNNHIITRDDYDKPEDYDATYPDNYEAKITDITSWTHDDLVHNTVLGVNCFMTYWCWRKVISKQYHPTKHNHGLPDQSEFNIKDGISLP
jgi:hypothetical protein